MRISKKLDARAIVCMLVVVAGSFAASTVEASWVRARGAVGSAGSVDNLAVEVPPIPLVPTIVTGQFTDAQKGFRTEADLGNGALRGRAYVSGGSGNANANPAMGETVTFNNQTGSDSTWDFSYDIDGVVQTGANPFPVEQDFGPAGTFRTSFVQFGLHIFAGNSVGPTGSANAWNDNLGSALFSQVSNADGFPLTGNLQNFDATITDQISGSLPLSPGINAFDVVTIMAVAGSIPSNFDSSFDFNFLNTAAVTIDSAIDFSSDSGVFLTGMNNVPEPHALSLALLSLLAFGAKRRLR